MDPSSCHARILGGNVFLLSCNIYLFMYNFMHVFTFGISDFQWVFRALLCTPGNASVSQKCHLCYRPKWLYGRQKN